MIHKWKTFLIFPDKNVPDKNDPDKKSYLISCRLLFCDLSMEMVGTTCEAGSI